MNPDSPNNYPRFSEVLKRLNALSRADLKDMANQDSVDMLTRVHLNQFLKDWLVDDNGLGAYQDNIPEDYPRDEALMLGDMLVFLMVGGEKVGFGSAKGFERPYINLEGGGKMRTEQRYADDLAKMRRKMPEGKSFSDMVGVHAMVLYSLPQKKFHRYNIEQIFRSDPSLADSFFETTNVRISPADFETLSNLKEIVDRGAIEQFRLAMSAGTAGLKSLSGQGSTFGQALMDAYRIAESAVAYFSTGDFARAVDQLQILQDDYKVGTSSFASNMNNMFVATISSLEGAGSVRTGNDEHYTFAYKGNQTPVLMSLHTQFVPEKGPNNILNAARGAARVASAHSHAWKNNKFDTHGKDNRPSESSPTAGTNGNKTVMLPASKKSGNNWVLDVDKMYSVVTTDWGAIFAGAYGYGRKGIGETVNPTHQVMNKGYEEMFADGRQPILKFLVHGTLQYGLTNLMPTGVLTVSLMKRSNAYGAKYKDAKYAMGGYSADIFYESFSPRDDLAQEYARIAADDEEDTDDNFMERMDIPDPNARRRARKRPSKKKPSMGQMIAIDLVPTSQVRLSTAVNKATWYKETMKKDESGMLKELWDEFARGAPEPEKRGRRWFWKGKYYATKKEVTEAFKKANTTYADRKGKTNMSMLYAKRKDNGELVPFRIFIPKILMRKRGDDLLPKKGGYYGQVKHLLDTIEESFGKIKFKVKFSGGPGAGYSRETKKGTVSVDKGIDMLFQTEGLEAGEAFSTKARPSRVKRDGNIVYQAMVPTGTSVELEVSQ